MANQDLPKGKKDNSGKSGAAKRRKEEKKAKALDRTEARQERDDEAQLALLIIRPGKSEKETKRLKGKEK